jgi:hypothetical protein
LLRGRRDGGGREGATPVVPPFLLCMCAWKWRRGKKR